MIALKKERNNMKKIKEMYLHDELGLIVKLEDDEMFKLKSWDDEHNYNAITEIEWVAVYEDELKEEK